MENGEERKRVAGSGRVLVMGVACAAAVLAVSTWWGRYVAYRSGWKQGPAPLGSEALKGDTARWVPFKAVEHPLKPTEIWGNVRRPYPTGAWWTNLVVGGPSSQGDGLGAAMQTPYAVRVTPEVGVALSYGALSATNESLTISASTDLGVSLAEGVARRYVMTHDDLTMTMRLEGEAGKMDALFARGSPYTTFLCEGAKLTLRSDFEVAAVRLVSPGAANTSLSRRNMPSACAAYPSCVSAGMKGECCPMDEEHGRVTHPCCSGELGTQGPGEIFSVELTNGQHWRVYTSTPLTLRWTKDGVDATEPLTGILRVALVPDDSGLSAAPLRRDNATVPDAVMLDAHAESYPTSGEVRVSADRSRDTTVGEIEFSWRVAYLGSTLSLDSETKTPALLMLALPHHVDSIVADSSVGFLPPGSLDFRGGLKGPSRAVLGARWRLRLDLTPVSWTPPRILTDLDVRAELAAQLRADVTRQNGEPDSMAAWMAFDTWFCNAYWNGKEAARLATLALVAEELRQDDSLRSAKAQLRAILEVWLEGTNIDPLVYDATYGGLCTKNGLDDHDADFGNGYYNDHHFHYGYMLYAAAVAVKLDADFASQYRLALFALMYDVADPGLGASLFEPGVDRSAFPKARHKDFYDGHSWASGIFFMGQGKAQESSSEAINAYYGAYLLGLAYGDVELADWNRVLLAMEIQAAKTYYHMPKDTPIYPKPFARNKMVGVLGALSTGSTTWFGPSTAFSHGIQVLPVTPITQLVLSPNDFVAEDIRFLDAHLDRDNCDDAWLAFVECIRAVLDPKSAYRRVKALSAVDPGTTKTALLYWIATRPPPDDLSPAQVDANFFKGK